MKPSVYHFQSRKRLVLPEGWDVEKLCDLLSENGFGLDQPAELRPCVTTPQGRYWAPEGWSRGKLRAFLEDHGIRDEETAAPNDPGPSD